VANGAVSKCWLRALQLPAERVQSWRKKAPASTIWELAGGSLEAVTSEMVGQASMMGEAAAHAILAETVGLLSVWL
jgi:hypothetical protein